MTEQWIDIKGYEGRYAVSSEGRIKSYNWHGHKGLEHIMKCSIDINGYPFVHLYKNGGFERFFLHRLIATYYVPNTDNKPYVDHIDGDPSNSHPNNLRWCTHKENLNYPLCKERMIKASKTSKPVYATKNGKTLWYSSVSRFAKENNLSRGSAAEVILHKRGRTQINGWTLKYA